MRIQDLKKEDAGGSGACHKKNFGIFWLITGIFCSIWQKIGRSRLLCVSPNPPLPFSNFQMKHDKDFNLCVIIVHVIFSHTANCPLFPGGRMVNMDRCLNWRRCSNDRACDAGTSQCCKYKRWPINSLKDCPVCINLADPCEVR